MDPQVCPSNSDLLASVCKICPNYNIDTSQEGARMDPQVCPRNSDLLAFVCKVCPSYSDLPLMFNFVVLFYLRMKNQYFRTTLTPVRKGLEWIPRSVQVTYLLAFVCNVCPSNSDLLLMFCFIVMFYPQNEEPIFPYNIDTSQDGARMDPQVCPRNSDLLAFVCKVCPSYSDLPLMFNFVVVFYLRMKNQYFRTTLTSVRKGLEWIPRSVQVTLIYWHLCARSVQITTLTPVRMGLGWIPRSVHVTLIYWPLCARSVQVTQTYR